MKLSTLSQLNYHLWKLHTKLKSLHGPLQYLMTSPFLCIKESRRRQTFSLWQLPLPTEGICSTVTLSAWWLHCRSLSSLQDCLAFWRLVLFLFPGRLHSQFRTTLTAESFGKLSYDHPRLTCALTWTYSLSLSPRLFATPCAEVTNKIVEEIIALSPAKGCKDCQYMVTDCLGVILPRVYWIPNACKLTLCSVPAGVGGTYCDQSQPHIIGQPCWREHHHDYRPERYDRKLPHFCEYLNSMSCGLGCKLGCPIMEEKAAQI